MRVTEQVEALSTLSTNPYKYLIVPRVLAGIITMPLLVVIADVVGVMGGFLICVYLLNFNGAIYIRDTWANSSPGMCSRGWSRPPCSA